MENNVSTTQEAVEVDMNEMVTFISEELSKINVEVSDENILNVLDLELEFLKLKGIVE